MKFINRILWQIFFLTCAKLFINGSVFVVLEYKKTGFLYAVIY